MDVYILTEYNATLLEEANLQDLSEDILNSGAVYETLEKAQQAVRDDLLSELEQYYPHELADQAETDRYNALRDKINELEWANLAGLQWSLDTDVFGDDVYYLIRKVPVL